MVGKAPPSEYPCCANGVCDQHQQMHEMKISRKYLHGRKMTRHTQRLATRY